MSDCVDLVLDARLWLCACAAGQLPTSRVGILCRDRWGTIASELNAPDETRYSLGPQGRSTAIVLCTPQSLLGIVKRPWRTGVPTRLRIDHRQFGSIPRHARRLALVAVVPMVPAIGAPSDVPSPRWAVYSPRSDPPLCLAATLGCGHAAYHVGADLLGAANAATPTAIVATPSRPLPCLRPLSFSARQPCHNSQCRHRVPPIVCHGHAPC